MKLTVTDRVPATPIHFKGVIAVQPLSKVALLFI